MFLKQLLLGYNSWHWKYFLRIPANIPAYTVFKWREKEKYLIIYSSGLLFDVTVDPFLQFHKPCSWIKRAHLMQQYFVPVCQQELVYDEHKTHRAHDEFYDCHLIAQHVFKWWPLYFFKTTGTEMTKRGVF